MRIAHDGNGVPRGLVLSRRNLLALLAKVDGHPTGSVCTLVKDGFFVSSELDAVHYGEREPGALHPDTLLAMREPD